MNETSTPNPASAFQVRDFRLLTQARFLFAFATQAQSVVLGWQIYEIKHDPLYLGLAGLAEAVPALSLAIFAGHLTDRGNPLTIYKNVVRLTFLASLLLLLVSGSFLGADPLAKLPWIYSAAFIAGIARGFSGPSLYSLVPQLIKRDLLKISAAWITAAFQIAAVSGPAIGGILFALRGADLPYTLNAVMLLGALGSLALIRHRPTVKAPDLTKPWLEGLFSGLKFVFSHDLLLSALAMDMFAVFFGGVSAVLPIFAGDILHCGPRGLGMLRASPAVGALLMSAYLIRKPVDRGAGKILLSVVAGFGFCIIGFALSRNFLLSAFLLVLSGALDSVSMVMRSAIVQLSSPDSMRGRIASINYIFIGSSNELGAFESGVAAKLLGTVPSVIFGGAMTLVTVGLTAVFAPRLIKLSLSDLEKSKNSSTR